LNKNYIKSISGLKNILLLFSLIIFLIAVYICWYIFLINNSKEQLSIIKKNLIDKNIYISWNLSKTSGFPYRLENNLNDVIIKYKKQNIFIKNIKLINQPWKLKHYIIKINDEIKISNEIDNININIQNLVASYILKENLNFRASIQINKMILKHENSSYTFNKPLLHFRNTSEQDLDYAFLIKNIILPENIKDLKVKDINSKGKILKYKNFYFEKNNIINNSGIDIEKFDININNDAFTLQGFIGLDKNYNIISSVSFYSEGMINFLKFLNEKDFISDQLTKACSLIIKAVNISSKLAKENPIYTINIQNNYLSFMNIEIFKIPTLKKYFNY